MVCYAHHIATAPQTIKMAGTEARPTIKLLLVGRPSLAASDLSGQEEKEKKRIRMAPNS